MEPEISFPSISVHDGILIVDNRQKVLFWTGPPLGPTDRVVIGTAEDLEEELRPLFDYVKKEFLASHPDLKEHSYCALVKDVYIKENGEVAHLRPKRFELGKYGQPRLVLDYNGVPVSVECYEFDEGFNEAVARVTDYLTSSPAVFSDEPYERRVAFLPDPSHPDVRAVVTRWTEVYAPFFGTTKMLSALAASNRLQLVSLTFSPKSNVLVYKFWSLHDGREVMVIFRRPVEPRPEHGK